MSESKPGPSFKKPFLWLAALLVICGGVLLRERLRHHGAVTPAHEAELERKRVAALDPAFDPAKPAGSIEGLVQDADGRPVDGAVVAITRNRGADDLPTSSRPIPRTTTTAGGGRFQLADVLAGTYGVTATAPEGSPARQSKVEVRSGQASSVTLTLGKGGALLTGEVSDVGGGAIAGAKALLRTLGSFGRPGEEVGWFQVTTDDKGVFKVRLAAGDYDVTVRAEGYAPARDRVMLSTAQTRRYRLHPAARLAGRVLERDGKQPVPGANVWLRLDRLDSYVDREATSNSAGEFSFDDLAAGGYVVLARADHRIGISRTVDVGIAQAVTDLEVLVERGRAIRGTVVDADGKGLEGVRVGANRADPPFERPVFAKSTAGGSFALEGLLAAKYRINGWSEGKGRSKPETVQVTSRDVEGLRLQIAAPTVVRGQVVDAAGAGVPDVAVSGHTAIPGADRQFMMDRTTTDAGGKFEFTRLTPGMLTITARHPERGIGKWGPGPTPAETAPVTVRIEAAAAIAGTVTFEDGKPAARVIVFAPPAQMGGPMTAPPEQASTDEAGHYRIGSLDKGRYMVMARRSDTFMSYPRARQDVTLAVGEEKTGVDLVIPIAGKRIAGTVAGADGKPVVGAMVTAALEREGFAFRMPVREGFPSGVQAITDNDGAFALEDVQDGKYTLWAADSTHADGEVKGVAAGAGDVAIRLQGGASLAGVVQTKDGKPVSDYSVSALPGGLPGASPDQRFRNQMMARMWSPSAQVHDPAGAFFIGRLSPGAYDLTVTTADNQAGVLAIDVAAGEKKQGLAILIDAAATLTGRVVELDSGAPLEGVSVTLASPTSRQSVATAKDGTFTLTGVSPGRGRVDFRLGEGETHVPEHTDVDVKQGAGTVDVGVVRMLKGSWKERAGDFSARGRVGFTVSLVDGKPAVTGVIPGFPGAKAGLKQGDLVLSINGKSLEGMGNGALDFTAGGRIDQPVTVKVQPREGGAARDVTVERVPMDYDASRPGTNKPSGGTASAATPAPPGR